MSGINHRFKIILPLGGAVALAGFAGYIFYQLLRKDEEESEGPSGKSHFPVLSLTSIEIKIPKDAIGAVIGRKGANINFIQEKTCTSISFRDEGDEKTCTIRGKIGKVEQAKQLILKAVQDIPVIETLEMHVPVQAVGRIIGTNGNSIESIQRRSGTKIRIHDRKEFFSDISPGKDTNRGVVIKGTSEQLKVARTIILEKVKEEKEIREKISGFADNMSHRSNIRHLQDNPIRNDVATEEVIHENLPGFRKLFTPVFVSTVDTPTHFWLQVVGPKTVELDDLIAKMTEYYNDEKNKVLHELNKVNFQDIVAALFPLDNMWYRGRICEQNEHDPSKYAVFFVDFGDVEFVNIENIYELRTDFLKLSFQAVEAYLANIDPESTLNKEALQAFQSLSYASQWRQVMVKVLGYKHEGQDTIPCVQIVDTSGSQDVDIATELVKRGLANWSEDSIRSLSSSITSLPESLM